MLPTFVTLFVLVSVLVPDETYRYCSNSLDDDTCEDRKNSGRCSSDRAIPLLCTKSCFGRKCPECEDTDSECGEYHPDKCYIDRYRKDCKFTCAVRGIKCNGCPERSPNSYPNTLEYNNRCVWRYNKGRTFNAAENRCKSSEPAGHLVSFHSNQKYDLLRGYYTEQEYKGIWIGLKKQSDGRLSWTDGSPADFVPKDIARDNGGSPPFCYYIQSTLRGSRCGNDKPYICSAPAAPLSCETRGGAKCVFPFMVDGIERHTCVRDYSFYNKPYCCINEDGNCVGRSLQKCKLDTCEWGSECPDGYTPWNGMCYKFFKDPLKQDHAEEECSKETGGHLAAFQSNEEYTHLRNFHNHSGEVWIGLQYDTDNSRWSFTNGDGYLYRPRDNDLDVYQPSFKCAAIRAGLREDGTCTGKRSYLCSFEKLTKVRHWD